MDWRQVTETLEAGSIVVVDEAIEEGVSIGVRNEEPMSDAAFRLPADRFDDAAVEAFDEAVGVRPIGSGEAVVDATLGADAIEGPIQPDPRRMARGLVYRANRPNTRLHQCRIREEKTYQPGAVHTRPDPDELISIENVRLWGKSRSGRRKPEVFAVGTAVTDRPPLRSVRAEFPHTAPTLGV